MLRELGEHDADAVVAVYASAWGDDRPIDAAEIVSWERNPEIDRDLMRVLEQDGRVVGYGDLAVSEDVVAVEVAAPGCWNVFLAWAEDIARQRSVPRVRVLLYRRNELEEVAAARGYRYWRSTHTMQVDLGGDDPVAVARPAGIELREYGDADLEPLRAALNEAFGADPFHERLTPAGFREFHLNARGFDPTLWLLAWAGNELAGFVLAAPERLGDRSLGWIDSIGVRPAWRRRGIARALLAAAFARLHAHGLRRVGLGVDAGNETNALRLYEGAGMQIVRRADNWVLDL